MSNINVGNVNSIADSDRVSGQAKAWANLNGGGTIALRDSFNVASVTDLATSRYQYNFTNSFAAANYCPTTSSSGVNPGDSGNVFSTISFAVPTVSSFAVSHRNNAGAEVDPNWVLTAVHGDLA